MSKPAPPITSFDVTPVYLPRHDWLDEAAKQFQAISRLPRGWDSRGGDPPDPRLVEAAWNLLVRLAEADRGLSKPHIHPTPSGGVQFHWEAGQRYFEIDLSDADTAHYFFADRDAGQEEEGEFRSGAPLDAMIGFVRRVGNGS